MLDPVIHKHGFSTSLSSQPGAPADHTRFVLMVRHVGGHAEEHTWDAPIDDKGIKGNPNKTRLHGGGSSMAYAARYLKTNVFSVSTYRDDDGNAARHGRRRRADHPATISTAYRLGRSSQACRQGALGRVAEIVIRHRRCSPSFLPGTSTACG